MKQLSSSELSKRITMRTLTEQLAGLHPEPRILLVKENHQLCWWFQKALAMSRKNILL